MTAATSATAAARFQLTDTAVHSYHSVVPVERDTQRGRKRQIEKNRMSVAPMVSRTCSRYLRAHEAGGAALPDAGLKGGKVGVGDVCGRRAGMLRE
jgi:hypothetical protein